MFLVCPVVVHGLSRSGQDVVAGRCRGEHSAPSLDLLMLRPTLPAYNALLHLRERQPGYPRHPTARQFSPSREQPLR